MYRSCIFCSGPLGTNDSLETFPVGRQLAFDAWKGRLWAVCPRCGRWNLAPIEERWEAVEAAEKLFVDARLRVQSENVGLARLPDGTRLVRVGKAVPGELAAWRYGRHLLRRRKRYIIGSAATGVGIAGLYGGMGALGIGGGVFWMALTWWDRRHKLKIVHRIERPGSEDPLLVRRWHIAGMSVDLGEGPAESLSASPRADVDPDALRVHVRDARRKEPSGWTGTVRKGSDDIVVVSGAEARALLGRAMVHVNRAGATEDGLDDATRLLADAGSSERLLARAAARGTTLGKAGGPKFQLLAGPEALAFEMALNEEAERRALEGELADLEAAWREAEEIAAIADSLPGEDTLNRLLDRLR